MHHFNTTKDKSAIEENTNNFSITHDSINNEPDIIFEEEDDEFQTNTFSKSFKEARKKLAVSSAETVKSSRESLTV